MNANDIKKAKKIKGCLVAIATGLGLLALLALFYPRNDTLMVRCVSAATCLAAAVMWLLPTLPRLTFSRCLDILVAINILLLIGWGQIERVLYRVKWHTIYEEVGRMSKASSFDFVLFGATLSQTLRSGMILWIGVGAIWLLNILALMYLAQTLKGKEANQSHECTRN